MGLRWCITHCCLLIPFLFYLTVFDSLSTLMFNSGWAKDKQTKNTSHFKGYIYMIACYLKTISSIIIFLICHFLLQSCYVQTVAIGDYVNRKMCPFWMALEICCVLCRYKFKIILFLTIIYTNLEISEAHKDTNAPFLTTKSNLAHTYS